MACAKLGKKGCSAVVRLSASVRLPPAEQTGVVLTERRKLWVLKWSTATTKHLINSRPLLLVKILFYPRQRYTSGLRMIRSRGSVVLLVYALTLPPFLCFSPPPWSQAVCKSDVLNLVSL